MPSHPPPEHSSLLLLLLLCLLLFVFEPLPILLLLQLLLVFPLGASCLAWIPSDTLLPRWLSAQLVRSWHAVDCSAHFCSRNIKQYLGLIFFWRALQDPFMKVVYNVFMLTLQFVLLSAENLVPMWELSMAVRTAEKLVANFLLQKPWQVGLVGGSGGIGSFVLSLQQLRSQGDCTVLSQQHRWCPCFL